MKTKTKTKTKPRVRPPKLPSARLMGDLSIGEPHPAAKVAKAWIERQPIEDLALYQESLDTCAQNGNKLAQVCGATLRRLMWGQPVGDRYVLGLAWVLVEGKARALKLIADLKGKA
jgi:hypothetical protein